MAAVCPSATKSEFFSEHDGSLPYPDFILKASASPQRVAKAILKAIEGRGGAIIFPNLAASAMVMAEKAIPPLSHAMNVSYRNMIVSMIEKKKG